MKPSVEVLFKLLRIALGNESLTPSPSPDPSTGSGTGEGSFALPADVNWKEVIDLSFEQGVAAIAVDGLQRIYDSLTPNPSPEGEGDKKVLPCGEDLGEALSTLDSPELEDLKYEWFGEVFSCDQNYAMHNDVLRRLCSFWGSNGLKTVLLKGIGLSKYYPTPSHRPCGDIDVYLTKGSKSEPSAFDIGNKLIEEKHIKVLYANTKHSAFLYKGVGIENHKTLLYVDQTRALRYSNSVLESTLGDFVDSGEGYLLPSPLTNYIFLLRHIINHFLNGNGGASLRHLLDWGLFLNAERDHLDISLGNRLLAELGLTRMKEIFTRLAQYVTGCDLGYVLESEYASAELNADELRFMEDILVPKKELPRRAIPRAWAMTRNWLSQRWKFGYLDESFAESFCYNWISLAKYRIRCVLRGENW